MEEYIDQDVFVLPTRQEGFPVALLEAMSAGVVPVVSDIDSGVPEVVDDRTGMRPRAGDIGAFADAIARLDRERGQLDVMSAAARGDVAARFDVRDRVAAYQALYSRWQTLYRPSAGPEHLRYGSRLDQSWIPNPIVRLVRTAIATSKS
jgi:glycosyltransferase involved in cell wall biosynthesis